ncbi:MAG: hypothetical protein HY769_05090 [Candidatus Stahlbacteria bacterium]|nr:hypothetical protein [Candidatus Stahlbacteria bacterium]
MSKKRYLPGPDAEFDEWLVNFATKLPAIASSLGVPAALVTAVTNAKTNWCTQYPASKNAQDASRAAVSTKDSARDTAETAVSPVVGMMQSNPAFTDAQRETLRLTIIDTTPSPIPPEYVIQLAPPGMKAKCTAPKQVQIIWYAGPEGTESEAKPEGIDGVVIWYAEGGIPATEAGWKFLAMDTNSPYIHNVGNDATATIAYKVQWFDKRKRAGPFCDPVVIAVTA